MCAVHRIPQVLQNYEHCDECVCMTEIFNHFRCKHNLVGSFSESRDWKKDIAVQEWSKLHIDGILTFYFVVVNPDQRRLWSELDSEIVLFQVKSCIMEKSNKGANRLPFASWVAVKRHEHIPEKMGPFLIQARTPCEQGLCFIWSHWCSEQ